MFAPSIDRWSRRPFFVSLWCPTNGTHSNLIEYNFPAPKIRTSVRSIDRLVVILCVVGIPIWDEKRSWAGVVDRCGDGPPFHKIIKVGVPPRRSCGIRRKSTTNLRQSARRICDHCFKSPPQLGCWWRSDAIDGLIEDRWLKIRKQYQLTRVIEMRRSNRLMSSGRSFEE